MVALLVVTGGIVALATRSSGSGSGSGQRPRPADERAGSVRLDPSAPAVEVSAPPAAYTVTYEVEDWAGGDRVASVDTLVVRRPYQGRAEVRRSVDDDEPRSVTVTDFGRVSIQGSDAAPLLVDTPPALSASDLRLDAVLEDAVAAGLLERREQRRVAGQPCVVVRSKEPIASGTLSPAKPSATDYADTCVAASGLVLEEVWVTEGRVLRRRLATKVALDPPAASASASASAFEAFGKRLDPAEGGGSVRPVDPSTRPADAAFWDGVAVPPGFTYRGRYAVVPPQRSDSQSEDDAANPLARSGGTRVGAVADVWERGIDVLILEQGGSTDRSSVFDLPAGASTISVEGLGTGAVVLDGRLNELRFPLASGRYVRLLGTLPRATLEEAVRPLRDIGPGDGLRYLDG